MNTTPRRARRRETSPPRHRRPAFEALKPRVALATVAEAEPNDDLAQAQHLFGSPAFEVAGSLSGLSDVDYYLFNAVQDSPIHLHIAPDIILPVQYSLEQVGANGAGIWGMSAIAAPFGPPQVDPPADVTYVAPQTGTYLLAIQVRQPVTNGFVAQNGPYRFTLDGADTLGDAQVFIGGLHGRHVAYSTRNSTSGKPLVEFYYAKGSSVASIIGKPIKQFRLGPGQFGRVETSAAGFNLPRGRRPRGATYLIAVVNRKHSVPEAEATNDAFAMPLNGGAPSTYLAQPLIPDNLEVASAAEYSLTGGEVSTDVSRALISAFRLSNSGSLVFRADGTFAYLPRNDPDHLYRIVGRYTRVGDGVTFAGTYVAVPAQADPNNAASTSVVGTLTLGPDGSPSALEMTQHVDLTRDGTHLNGPYHEVWTVTFRTPVRGH